MIYGRTRVFPASYRTPARFLHLFPNKLLKANQTHTPPLEKKPTTVSNLLLLATCKETTKREKPSITP